MENKPNYKNLRKITRDIAQGDPDVRVLALTTVNQLHARSAENPQDFLPLYQALVAIAAGKDPELAFLAAKGQAHVKTVLETLNLAAPTEAEAPSAVAQETKDAVLAGLRVETDPGALAVLVAKLRRLTGDDVLQLAIGYTRHKESRVRAAAVESVRHHADDRSTAILLIPMLADPDMRVKATVARVLHKMDRGAITGVLGEMIASNKMPFREASVWTMGHLQGADMHPLLMQAAGDPYGVIRARAARGIANHGPSAASTVPALAKLLQDAEPAVREEAKRAALVLQGKAPPPEPLINLEELASQLPQDVMATPSGKFALPEKSDKEKAADQMAAIEKMLSGQTKLPRLEIAGKSYDQLLGIEGEQMVGLGRQLAEECRTGRITHPDVMKHYYDYLEYRDKIKQRREKDGDKDVSLTGSLFNLVRAKAGMAAPDTDPVRKMEERLHQAIMAMAKVGLDLMEKGDLKIVGAEDYVKRHKALRDALKAAKGGIPG